MFLVNLKIKPFLLIGSIIHLIEDRKKKNWYQNQAKI